MQFQRRLAGRPLLYLFVCLIVDLRSVLWHMLCPMKLKLIWLKLNLTSKFPKKRANQWPRQTIPIRWTRRTFSGRSCATDAFGLGVYFDFRRTQTRTSPAAKAERTARGLQKLRQPFSSSQNVTCMYTRSGELIGIPFWEEGRSPSASSHAQPFSVFCGLSGTCLYYERLHDLHSQT